MTGRVLVVDAAPRFRCALAAALTDVGYDVVGEAGDVPTSVELALALQPTLVVVDLDLPKLAGSDLVSRIRAAAPSARIVISTRAESDDDAPGAEDVRRIVTLVGDLTSPPSPTVGVDLPSSAASVSRARRFTETWCQAWEITGTIDVALLVVSELVTNAITHGQGTCALRLRIDDGALRVEVGDRGAGSPEITDAGANDEGGRGLRIVALSSRAWGVDGAGEGSKVVWAEIPLE